MTVKTEHVLFSGRVQGVGFRWTTESIARGFAVTGSVRNLPNGQVELTVQGEAAEINGLIDAIRQRFQRNIDGCERQELAENTEYSDFRIRR